MRRNDLPHNLLVAHESIMCGTIECSFHAQESSARDFALCSLLRNESNKDNNKSIERWPLQKPCTILGYAFHCFKYHAKRLLIIFFPSIFQHSLQVLHGGTMTGAVATFLVLVKEQFLPVLMHRVLLHLSKTDWKFVIAKFWDLRPSKFRRHMLCYPDREKIWVLWMQELILITQ